MSANLTSTIHPALDVWVPMAFIYLESRWYLVQAISCSASTAPGIPLGMPLDPSLFMTIQLTMNWLYTEQQSWACSNLLALCK